VRECEPTNQPSFLATDAPVDDNSQHGLTPEQKIAMIRAQGDLVEKQTAFAENPQAAIAISNAAAIASDAKARLKEAEITLIKENRRNQQGQEVDTFLSVSSSFDFI
jgi:hypothetical protein